VPLLVHLVAGCAPARFAQLAAGLVAAARPPGAPPRLLVAELTGDVALLGRHQRRASAVLTGPCARRFGGGRTVAAGDGVLGVLLAKHDLGVPPDRVLNRFVRGLNRGLSRCLGAPVHYFGRDHVVAGGGQLAVVSQEAHLFEAVVGVRRPLVLPRGVSGYPEHGDPRVSGLRRAVLGDVPTATIVQALAAEYASFLGLPLEHAEPPPEGPPLASDEDEDGWRASGLADVPIGFVEALVRCVGDRVAAVRIRGDFIAPAALVRAIEARLAHSPLDPRELTRRVAEAYETTPGAFIHGVLDLGVFAEAVREAARHGS
jgi:hypothetical protein